MLKLKKRGRKSPEIMLSPMIDMMFLLLIFFIVSTMYMSEARTVPVKLPVATQTVIQNFTKFNVTITDDGELWLGDQIVDEDDLIDRAKLERRKDEKFTVILRADGDVPYKTVIGLLDRFKKAGISRVGLATDKGANKHAASK